MYGICWAMGQSATMPRMFRVPLKCEQVRKASSLPASLYHSTWPTNPSTSPIYLKFSCTFIPWPKNEASLRELSWSREYSWPCFWWRILRKWFLQTGSTTSAYVWWYYRVILTWQSPTVSKQKIRYVDSNLDNQRLRPNTMLQEKEDSSRGCDSWAE